MTTIQSGTGMTLAEYRARDEMDDGVWELVDGALQQMAPPTYDHQNLITFLVGFINAYLDATVQRPGWAIPGIGVVLSERRAPTPDLIYVPAARAHLIQDSFVEGVPDLAVAVLSDDRARDLVMKRAWYAEAGVPEYWIIDPLADRLLTLELDGAEYIARAALGRGDTLTTPAIPGLALPLERLFGHPARLLPGRRP